MSSVERQFVKNLRETGREMVPNNVGLILEMHLDLERLKEQNLFRIKIFDLMNDECVAGAQSGRLFSQGRYFMEEVHKGDPDYRWLTHFAIFVNSSHRQMHLARAMVVSLLGLAQDDYKQRLESGNIEDIKQAGIMDHQFSFAGMPFNEHMAQLYKTAGFMVAPIKYAEDTGKPQMWQALYDDLDMLPALGIKKADVA